MSYVMAEHGTGIQISQTNTIELAQRNCACMRGFLCDLYLICISHKIQGKRIKERHKLKQQLIAKV
jgi:hypothetical protein